MRCVGHVERRAGRALASPFPPCAPHIHLNHEFCLLASAQARTLIKGMRRKEAGRMMQDESMRRALGDTNHPNSFQRKFCRQAYCHVLLSILLSQPKSQPPQLLEGFLKYGVLAQGPECALDGEEMHQGCPVPALTAPAYFSLFSQLLLGFPVGPTALSWSRAMTQPGALKLVMCQGLSWLKLFEGRISLFKRDFAHFYRDGAAGTMLGNANETYALNFLTTC